MAKTSRTHALPPLEASMLTITSPMQFSLIGNDNIRYKSYVINFSLSRFDRGLGGTEITLRLRKHLAKLFNEQKKTKTDVFTNDRSMGKLFKEAEKLKKILSANQYHYAQVLLNHLVRKDMNVNENGIYPALHFDTN